MYMSRSCPAAVYVVCKYVVQAHITRGPSVEAARSTNTHGQAHTSQPGCLTAIPGGTDPVL